MIKKLQTTAFLSACALALVCVMAAPDIAHAQNYQSPGTYTSIVLGPGQWDALVWEEILPAQTDITFQIRSGTGSSDEPEGGIFEADWSDPYTDPTGIDLSEEDVYLQYRATLTTESSLVTPTLESVTITRTGIVYEPSGTAESETVTPTSIESWNEATFDVDVPEDTDLYVEILGYDGEEWSALEIISGEVFQFGFDDNDITGVDDGSYFVDDEWGTAIFESVTASGGIVRFAEPTVDVEIESTYLVYPRIVLGGEYDGESYVRARVRLNTTSDLGEGDELLSDICLFTGLWNSNDCSSVLNEWVILDFQESTDIIESIGFQVPAVYYSSDIEDILPLEDLEFLVDWVEIDEGILRSEFTESPIDLSSVDVEMYSALRLRATLEGDTLVTPSVASWGISWNVITEDEEDEEESSSGGSSGGSSSSHRRSSGGGGLSSDSATGNFVFGGGGSVEQLMTQLLTLLQQLVEQLLAERQSQ